ncbi:MAG: tRNA (adenosine(37)-N6)-threonylcarbamoyltransferase complex ATPase subunit type 1 TsaE [Acidimicrobiia bacterium]|nr:tRNA (adenosine(37)-N6)-threonylcarbamoyltransferase complex ATPase subunit type 1 TsaE [Acidimicrobiia bacterium]MYC58341.1 tRNA (adenosine(37)-N6)-threonylcarbamoyltransferase complex ATPase subunit type 1 TsaE [Acidimicrobiia bacterium]MYG93516.1 tRNA (adenosine(37)-N6)-threonylcarbamoyltransferase complex ATPase subunit type 1 TsaE [Acidimicrobiia bacterium]MYI29952.1 tRNA (adenosine(37)-N6)-threonylcarbamoyltransferase complex ATPase subunit type 1 TsaE [Acidimicrobiia bacterium]
MIHAHTKSPAQTKDIGAALAKIAKPGDLLILIGDLGAGKTTFAQGFAAGLGITKQVSSPTFTLASEYQGRLLLHHLDVFRLEHLSEVLDLDLFELLDGDNVTLIEWGNMIRQTLPTDYLEIAFTFTNSLETSPDERTIILQPTGNRWQNRANTLSETLQPWITR